MPTLLARCYSPQECVAWIIVLVILVVGTIIIRYQESLHRARIFGAYSWRRAKVGFGRRSSGIGFKPFGGGSGERTGFFSSWR